jgi:hypothetical protein
VTDGRNEYIPLRHVFPQDGVASRMRLSW